MDPGFVYFSRMGHHRNEHMWTPCGSHPCFTRGWGFCQKRCWNLRKPRRQFYERSLYRCVGASKAAVIQNHVATELSGFFGGLQNSNCPFRTLTPYKRDEFEDLNTPASCRKLNPFIGESLEKFLGLADFFGEYFPQASYRPILRLHGRIHYLIASGTKARVSASGVDVFLEKASTWTGPHMHLAITFAHFSNSQNTQRFSEGFFFKHA